MIRPENQFNEQLTRYQRECESEEKRAELEDQRIANRVQELLAEGGSCYPWTVNNIFEAFTNAGMAVELSLSSFIVSAEKLPDNATMQCMCSLAIRNAIKEYWQEVARVMAEDGK